METSTDSPVKKHKKKSPEILKILSVAAIVVVACGVSFFAGTAYQKNKQPASLQGPLAGNFSDGQMGGRGMRQNGIFGTVASVSATSITINNQRMGTTSTKTINESTKITNNGSSVSADRIKTGDTVLVQLSTTDTNVATSININPSMRMGGGRPQATGDTTQNEQFDTLSN